MTSSPDCVIQDLGSAGLARTLVAGAMRALRALVLVMGLFMLICTSAQSDASVNKVEKTFRRIKDMMRLVENSADDASAQKKESALKHTHHLKTETGETILSKQRIKCTEKCRNVNTLLSKPWQVI